MIDEYFQILTPFPPRNFQREAIAKLLNHQDILLGAPTGSGRTLLFTKTLNIDKWTRGKRTHTPCPHDLKKTVLKGSRL
ncbi:hypothetical protein CDG77_01650 [Nostoc sp. 'Peltigera membranacea cyanobiont' 213]|uniref:hypothetical protein n=1 Tax=Nostoc sp. 'Peltigera membranacea cyanobiont' 213 TaxID=2014530 RepID=UPI000B953493|nr:hypothetical protein [Nostoc sp. 'Peltigera membranacea cyanobiont' 213]OYD99394.1 hypothetical protein CDG77_01650 [Nostoc sp. 'Peltigera membranacea cyanobiont' 213]